MKTALVLATAKQSDLLRLCSFAQGILCPDDMAAVWVCDKVTSEFTLQMPKEVQQQVFCSQGLNDTPEAALAWLGQMMEQQRPDLLLFYDNIAGHQLAVRMGARLGCDAFTDVHTLGLQDGTLTVMRKTCGAHLDWEEKIETFPAVASVARGRARETGEAMQNAEIQAVPLESALPPSRVLARQALEQRQENPLESCERLFVGGKGLGGREACEALRAVAARYGAVPGFTRPVALNGWCGLHEIVGQSGVRSSPEVCVTFGVSGAAAFLAGVQGAQKLVAVNTDADAPIFHHAHVGIVADANEVLAAL